MTQYIEEYKKIFNGKKFLRNNVEVSMSQYRAFDGGGVRALLPLLLDIAKEKVSISILDFGCGEAIHWNKKVLAKRTKTLPEILDTKLRGFFRYDPCYEPFSKKPEGTFDVILCSDVLEHIPEESLSDFFKEINSFTNENSIILYSISTLPSKNSFLDGTNMHINLKTEDDWNTVIKEHSKCRFFAIFNPTLL